jgi:carbamoyltransferase
MNVLGLQFGHDAGAAVIRDGRVASFVLRERLSRIKHALSLDMATIELALAEAGISDRDIDYAAITSTQKTELISLDPQRLSISLETHKEHGAPCSFGDAVVRAKLDINSLLQGEILPVLYHSPNEDPAAHAASYYFPEFRTVPEKDLFSLGWLDTYLSIDLWSGNKRLADIAATDYRRLLDTDVVRHGFHYPATLKLNARDIPAYFISHHMAHAASIYYPLGLRQAAIFTHDGFGSGKHYHGGMYYVGDGHKIFPVAPHHLIAGHMYEQAGLALNMGLVGASGKLMGLAPYGNAYFMSTQFVGNDNDLARIGITHPARNWVGYCLKFAKQQGYDLSAFRDKARMTERVNVDIAASTQRIFEMTMQAALEVFQRVLEKLGRPGLPLCYAGGTALNCPANTLMAGRTGFASMHIPPWCDDSGLSLGAALALYHNVLDQPLPADAGPRKDVDAYLGAAPAAGQADTALAAFGKDVVSELRSDWAAAAAQDLADDKVIGWYEGRSEIGPRALGHRSILADARKAENWQRVNVIKQREAWRPFAPAVLAEHAGDWFGGIPLPSPHMLYTAQLKSTAVPAITHVDKSARIQTVDESAGAFHALLQEFHARTGVPMVLNTSFNGPGEPIVESPGDALRFFVGSSLDALYLDGRRITKR